MAKWLAHARFIIGALALMFIVAVAAPATRRSSRRSVNPTASSVKEDQLFSEMNRISAAAARIPDQKSCTIEQPAGRDWREFHQVTLPWIGAIAILGMLALLVVFYLMRGMVKIENGRSGRLIVRFNAFERFVHWMTATCFIVLALSGLNITFGKQTADAADRAGRLRHLVAVGQIRPQLPELPVHHRRRADAADVDRRQHPEPGRHRMDQARRRHRRQ